MQALRSRDYYFGCSPLPVMPAALRHSADKDGAKEKMVADALDVAPHVIRGAKYRIGSQFHFYMEPQARATRS